MARQQPVARQADGPLKIAIFGPERSDALAVVHESGGTLVADARTADVVHLTVGPGAVTDALATVLPTARAVVIHECPVAPEPAVIAELARDAEAAGILVAVPFVRRYYPMVRLARRRIRSGTPGPLQILHGWAMPNSATAWCDLVEFISRHRIERVVASSVAPTYLDSAADILDTPGATGLLFETNHGAIGTLAVSQSRPPDGGSMVMFFDGVEETIMFHEGRPELLDVMGPRATERFQRGVGAEVSRYSTQRPGRPQGHRDCWSSFVADAHAAARGRTPEGLPTLADLARSAQLSAAVRDASATAAWAPVTRTESELPTITEGTTA